MIPLVGRARELAVLSERLAGMFTGRGCLLLIAGEPGIGKTRLLAETARMAERHTAVALWGRCWERGGAPPYWPWIEILRRRVRQLDDAELARHLGHGAAELAHIVPAIRARVPRIAARPMLDSDQARFRLFDAVTEFLRASADTRPLVLLLDDLHAADVPSLLLLKFLARALGGGRLLVVCAYREVAGATASASGRVLAEIAREGDCLHPARLSEPEVAEIMAQGGVPPPTPSVVAQVYGVTEGNPFFVDEVLRHLRAGMPRAHEEGRIALPPTARTFLRGRLSQLSARAYRVLQLAAVAGRDFDVRLLQHLSAAEPGLVPTDVLAELADACRAGLIVERDDRPGRYRFTHGLIVETVYADLPPDDRARLHHDIGVAIEALTDGRAAELPVAMLSHHFAHAVPLAGPAKAVAYAERAGERARRLVAYEDAIRHYRRALDLLDLMPPNEARRCELLLALGDAEWGAGEIAESRASFARVAAMAARIGGEAGATLLARAALGLGGRQQRAHVVVDAELVDLLERALAALDGGDEPLRARLAARLAYALYCVPDSHDRRAQLCRLALAGLQSLTDLASRARVLADVRWAQWGPDTFAERLDLSAELMRIAERTGDGEEIANEHAWCLLNRLESGDVAGAAAQLEELARRAAALRSPWHEWYVLRFRAMHAILAGQLSQGEALAQEALAVGERIQHPDAAMVFGVQLVHLRLAEGRGAELEAALKGFAAQYPAVTAWRHALIALYADAARAVDARAEFEPLAQHGFRDLRRDFTYLSSLAFLSSGCVLLCDRRRARQLYGLLLPYAERAIVIGNAIVCLGSGQGILAQLAATAGHPLQAARHFEAAIDRHRQMGARLLLAQTELAYARFLLAEDASAHGVRAAALADGAAAAYAALGLSTRAQSAAALARDCSRRTVSPRIFRRDGEYWSIAYSGRTFRLRDLRGLAYIAYLLAHPGQRFHATELVAASGPRAGVAPRPPNAQVLLGQRIGAARRRVRALSAELDEAEAQGDSGRRERAHAELVQIERELDSAVDPDGPSGASAGTPRAAVTMAIAAACRRIAGVSPELARYLRATLRTGRFCTYAPDPTSPPWLLE